MFSKKNFRYKKILNFWRRGLRRCAKFCRKDLKLAQLVLSNNFNCHFISRSELDARNDKVTLLYNKKYDDYKKMIAYEKQLYKSLAKKDEKDAYEYFCKKYQIRFDPLRLYYRRPPKPKKVK